MSNFDVKEEVRKVFGGHNWRHWRGPIEDLVNRAIDATEEKCARNACPYCRLPHNKPSYLMGGNWHHRSGQRCLASDVLQLSRKATEARIKRRALRADV